jgi:hypothetical protein
MSTLNKTIVISTNDHPNYINYWPYVTKAWNKLGWNTLTFYLGTNTIQEDINNKIVKIDPINEYRDETVVQVSRLFGHKHIDYGIIMTSDVDMMPLTDYWKPGYEDITIYGFDLTKDKQIPICYIAMNSINWKKIIPENSIEELLTKYSIAKSDSFNEYWYTDQKIVTERILKYKYVQIDRKNNKGLGSHEIGRIDRARWTETKNNDTLKIDAHLPRPFNQKEVEELFKKYYDH